jgi:hypothetical protein
MVRPHGLDRFYFLLTLHIRSGQGCVALAGTICSRLLDVVVGQLLILIGLTCIAFIAKRLQV